MISIKVLAILCAFADNLSYNFGFKLEVNQNRYDQITIYLIRSKEKVENQPLFHRLTSVVNTDLNHIVSTNQHLQYATWRIMDSYYGFKSIYPIVESRHNNASFLTFSSEKVFWRSGNKASYLTLVFTQLLPIWSMGEYWHVHDLKYYKAWSDWLSYVTGHRKLALFKDNIVVFVISYANAFNYLFIKDHNSLFSSPFLTFVFDVKHNVHNFGRNELEIHALMWVCHLCTSELSYYMEKNIFKGALDEHLILAYHDQTAFIRKNNLFANSGSPVLVITRGTDNPDVGLNEARKSLPYNKKLTDVYLNYHKGTLLETHGYYNPYVLTMSELGNTLNYSIYFGGTLTLEWRGRYAQAWIHAGNFRTANLRDKFYSEVFLTMFWDTSSVRISYIEDRKMDEDKYFFQILANPFDLKSWICLFTSLVLITIYLRRFCIAATKTKSVKFADAVFEVTRIALQKNVRKVDTVKVAALFGFFFTEFFYLTSLTNEIIKPLNPYVMQTLNELFNLGYKIVPQSIYSVLNEDILVQFGIQRRFLFGLMESNLRSEGFLQNISAPEFLNRYWWQVTAWNVSSTERIFNSWQYRLKKKSIMIDYVDSFSIHSKAKTTTVPAYVSPNKTRYIHYLKKSYGHNIEVVNLCSRFSKLFEPSLKRVMWESGIKKFWYDMKTDLNGRYQKRSERVEKKSESIKLYDKRILALLKLTVSLLVVCTFWLLLENRKIVGQVLEKLSSTYLYIKQNRISCCNNSKQWFKNRFASNVLPERVFVNTKKIIRLQR